MHTAQVALHGAVEVFHWTDYLVVAAAHQCAHCMIAMLLAQGIMHHDLLPQAMHAPQL